MFSGGDGDSFRPIPMKAALTMRSHTAEISPSVSTERISQQQQQLQWAEEETKDLIRIRAVLERDFTATRRNKALWEIVSSKMRERGYRRTPDQCKCKWKNLVNRYKGKETSDPENGLHCPFFEELHAVFTERAKGMQRLLVESETVTTQRSKRVKRGSGSLDELSEDEDEDEEGSGGERPTRINSRKRKVETIPTEMSTRVTSTTSSDNGGIQEMLKEFFQQQQRMEMDWREMMERRAHEQRLFEQEWRQSMEKIERERLMVEQAWREREEQRRIREESRAERRDALLTSLLNKLIHENDTQGQWSFS